MYHAAARRASELPDRHRVLERRLGNPAQHRLQEAPRIRHPDARRLVPDLQRTGVRAGRRCCRTARAPAARQRRRPGHPRRPGASHRSRAVAGACSACQPCAARCRRGCAICAEVVCIEITDDTVDSPLMREAQRPAEALRRIPRPVLLMQLRGAPDAGPPLEPVEHRLQKRMQRRLACLVVPVQDVHALGEAEIQVVELAEAFDMEVDQSHHRPPFCDCSSAWIP